MKKISSMWDAAAALSHLGTEASSLGLNAAEIICILFRGWQHVDPKCIRRANWKDHNKITFPLPRAQGMATFDTDHLTQLVVMAHDACVKVTLKPFGPHRMAIEFTPRVREGGTLYRHPTIEEAVADNRKLYQISEHPSSS